MLGRPWLIRALKQPRNWALLLISVAAICYLRLNARPPAQSAIHSFATCNEDCALDVIFLHGVEGDHILTWQGSNGDFWPKWIAEDFEKSGVCVSVWSIDYPAATQVFVGQTMGLQDRARNLLGVLEAKHFQDYPNRPLVFIGHSFGGLVSKEMLRIASDSPNEAWKTIATRTKGVVLIATPNTGSNLATYLEFLFGSFMTRTSTQLKYSETHLNELNRWYIRNAPTRGIETLAFWETQETKGIHVVPEASADPNIASVEVQPIDADHFTICKLSNRDDTLFGLVCSFLEKLLMRAPPPELPVPTQQNNFCGCSDFPSKEQVSLSPPASELKPIVLEVINETGEAIRLSILDCSIFYAGRRDCWTHLDLNIVARPKFFEKLFSPNSRGWCGLFVSTERERFSDCLAAANLFVTSNPRIIVSGNAPDYQVRIE